MDNPNKKSALILHNFRKTWGAQRKLKTTRRTNQSFFVTMDSYPYRKKVRQTLRTNKTKLSSSRVWVLQTPRLFNFRSKVKKKAQAVIHARFTFTNTHLTLRTFEGKTLLKLSAGFMKNVKKSKPFANYLLGEAFGQQCKEEGYKYLYFSSEGTSRNRKTLFRGLAIAGIKIMRVSLKARLPHNGCRPPRVRRI